MELICIVCPNGCHLTVESTQEGVIVSGNKCPKGEVYGRDEFTDPRRIITAVVRTTSPDYPVVPVKSSRAVPKNDINRILKSIYTLEVDLPVKRGDTCMADCGVPETVLVYTRTVPPVKGDHG
jgi:CxxC motif-containing protein